MTSADDPDFDLSHRLAEGLKRIASARGVESVLLATATTARALADAAGVCAATAEGSQCVIAIPEIGSVSTLDGGSPLQRLIADTSAGRESIVQDRPQLEVQLPAGRRVLAETMLTVPMGPATGYLGLAFFWHNGRTPTAAQLTLLPGLAWTCCLALRNQRNEAHLHESRLEQQMQLGEIQHRARNLLATLRSIVRRSGQTAESAEEFASHLEARISALARTQGALTIDRRSGPELEDLIRAELTANAVRDDQFVIAGSPWRLPARTAEILALTLHELTMNAVKFGAFTIPDGRLAVTWNIAITPKPTLHWRWVESNVSIDESPRRLGFGRELIERQLPYELGAVTRYTIAQGGARCEIDLPINEQTVVNLDGVSS